MINCNLICEKKANSSSDSSSLFLIYYPFERQFHKMVKHTQTIRRQIADELFECVWLFCGIGA